MKTHNFSLEEVKQVDMVEYLEKLGHQPKKIRGNDYWYLSPFKILLFGRTNSSLLWRAVLLSNKNPVRPPRSPFAPVGRKRN
jgi:hypothetical protein